MKLQELATRPSSLKINRVNESRFGFSIDYDKLTVPKARSLSRKLGENIQKLKQSFGSHTAEKNPRYMELLMVREGLQRSLEPLLIPACVALRPEEHSSLIVVHAMDLQPERVEVRCHLTANQPR